jgi:hypothetical protein
MDNPIIKDNPLARNLLEKGGPLCESVAQALGRSHQHVPGKNGLEGKLDTCGWGDLSRGYATKSGGGSWAQTS